MTRKMNAHSIRQASFSHRLVVATNYRRAALQPGITTEQQAFLRLAARFVLGSVKSAEYDIIARLQILEAAAGQTRMAPHAGTWWKKGRRGLKSAQDAYAGTNIDPSWFSNSTTGLINIVFAQVQREFGKLFGSGGSASSAEDIIQNGLMGLTKNGMAALSGGPIFIQTTIARNKGGGLYQKIIDGKETPQSFAGVGGKFFAQKVRDEMMGGDRPGRRAPSETETGESTLSHLPSQVSEVTFWDFLASELSGRTPLGRKLEQKMRQLAGNSDLANALIDRLVAGGHIGSISGLSKELGGSGSGGSVRWVKDSFFPKVRELVDADDELLQAYWKSTGGTRMAARKTAGSLSMFGFDRTSDIEFIYHLDGFAQVGMGGEWWNSRLKPGNNVIHHRKEKVDDAYRPVTVKVEKVGHNIRFAVMGGFGGGATFMLGFGNKAP